MLKAKGSKALSLVLAVAMLVTLCCTYLFTSAEPIKAVGKTESVQLTYGGDHVWPKDGNGAAAGVDFNFNSQDISSMDFLEFDFYIDNVAALKQEKDFGELFIRLFSEAPSEGASRNFMSATFTDQVIRNGKNHIKLSLSSLIQTDGGVLNREKVNGVRFYMENYGTIQASRDYSYSLKNVFATKNSANSGAKAIHLSHGNTDPFAWESGKIPEAVAQFFTFAAPEGSLTKGLDISDCTYLEADLYVDDIAALKQEEKFGGLKLRLFTTAYKDDEGGWNNKLTWDVTDQVYQNGWNHIKVPLSGGAGEGEPDLSTATWLQFFMEDYTGMHASRDYALALSNLYATKASDNPMTETLLISANGADASIGQGGHPNNGGFLEQKIFLPEAVDVSAYDNMEFDLYIDNLETFRAEQGFNIAKLTLLAKADNGAMDSWDYRNIYRIYNQITKDGWNHITVPLRGGRQEDAPHATTDKLNELAWIRIAMETPSNAASSTGHTIKFQNFTVTREKTAAADETLLFKGSVNEFYTDMNRDWILQEYTFPEAKDLSGYDYIALDYVLSDLAAIMDSDKFAGVNLRLCNEGDRFFQYPLTRSILTTGKNRVILPLQTFSDAIGDPDMKAITKIKVFIENSSAGILQPARDCQVGAANIAVGNFQEVEVDPNEKMIADCENVSNVAPGGSVSNWVDTTEYTQGFASIRALFKSYEDAAPGWKNNLRIDLNQPVDISSCNVIKFDLYVSDPALYAAEFQPTMYFTINNNYGTLDKGLVPESFVLPKELKKGWNTITIDISDRTKLDLDLTKIYNVGLNTTNPEADPLSVDHGWNHYSAPLTLRLDNVRATIDPDKTIVDSYKAPENSVKVTDGKSLLWVKGGKTDIYPVAQFNIPEGLDFTGMGTLDLNVYVSDWEAMKASEGFTGLKIRFYPTEGLGDDSAITIPMDTANFQSGWNHVQASLKNVAIEKLYALRIFIEDNATAESSCDLKLSYKNIYAVKAKEGEGPIVPENPDQPARPDTGAVYISDCETLDDPEAGSWYPSTVKLDTKSKSEGKASVTNNLSAEQALRENSFRFVPVSPLDLTGGKELRFDMYVSDPALLAQRTSWAVRLSSSSRGTDDYIQWTLADFGTLKEGWNSVTLKLDDAKTSGDFQLSSVEAFYMLAEEASFEEGELVMVKLDNIRVSGASSGDKDDNSSPDTGVAAPVLPAALAVATGGSAAAVLLSRKKKGSAK